jgi:hypothetical protein
VSPRRRPIDTPHRSTTIYPSGLFSLERDETFPYERFAHNLLDIAVEALHEKNLPESLTIDFTQLMSGGSPWTINSSVTVIPGSGQVPMGFRFVTPELVPAIVYMLVATVVSYLLSRDDVAGVTDNPVALVEKLRFFIDGASAGVRAYRERGFGHGIRAAYDHLGLTMEDLQRSMNDYDLLTKQIAYHEVAHAYTEQLTREPYPTLAEKRSFELIADLLAVEWLYRKIIVNTPDTPEYRQFRALNSYADSIFSNSLMLLRSQQALLLLMAVAGSQRTGGRVTVEGGQTHPPGMHRFLLQHVHLYTLIRSNFSTVLTESNFEELERDWDMTMDLLVRSGVLPNQDLRALADVSECDTIELAAHLIEQRDIRELRSVVPLLRSIRERLNEG